MTPRGQPTATDPEFHQAMEKALQLDQQLQPALLRIYRHLLNVLETDQDRGLFQLFIILQSGSYLSLYAPRYLLTMETILGDYLDIYTSWAKKAEELLQQTERTAGRDRSK